MQDWTTDSRFSIHRKHLLTPGLPPFITDGTHQNYDPSYLRECYHVGRRLPRKLSIILCCNSPDRKKAKKLLKLRFHYKLPHMIENPSIHVKRKAPHRNPTKLSKGNRDAIVNQDDVAYKNRRPMAKVLP